jgi:hypothetical protein
MGLEFSKTRFAIQVCGTRERFRFERSETLRTYRRQGILGNKQHNSKPVLADSRM